MRSILKSKLIEASYHLKLPSLNDKISGGRLRAVMYHGIPSRDTLVGIQKFNEYHVTTNQFENQMRYLSTNCNVLSFDDAVHGRNFSDTKTNILISFDDGYETQFTNAFQTLKEYEFPAIYGLPTGFIFNRDPLFNDVFEYAVNHSESGEYHIVWKDQLYEFNTLDQVGRLRCFKWLIDQAVSGDLTNRAMLTNLVYRELGLKFFPCEIFKNPNYRPLTQDQINVMVNSGLATFASHSVNHSFLSAAGELEREAEIRDSREHVQRLSGTVCNIFCIPGNSYDNSSVDEMIGSGYEYILSSDRGDVDFRRTVLSRRVILKSYSFYEFVDICNGPILALFAKLRHLLIAAKRLLRFKVVR